MPDPFVHLHVASGYSLAVRRLPSARARRAGRRAGDGHPRADRPRRHLRRGPVRQGLPAGRDPAGARRRPRLRPGRRRSPGERRRERPAERRTRGPRSAAAPSATRELPRVTFLAGGKAGWAAICRLVSATHLAGERGRPGDAPSTWSPSTLVRAATCWCCSARPRSSGAAATLRRDDLARAALAPWRELVAGRPAGRGGLPPAARAPGPGSSPHAARMAGLAREAGLGRGAHQRGPLRRPRSTRRPSTCSTPPAGWSRSTCATSTAATPRASSSPASRWPRWPRRSAGSPGWASADARDLLARTRVVADRCALDPRADLGLGEVHFPEFEPRRRSATSAGPRGDEPPTPSLRARCEAGDRPPLRHRAAAADLEAARRRAADDPGARLRLLLPHRRRRHRPDPRDGGAVRGPRVGRRAAWSTTCSASPGSTRCATAC